jgi:hypothetical protein
MKQIKGFGHDTFFVDPLFSFDKACQEIERETGKMPLSFKTSPSCWDALYWAIIKEYRLGPEWDPVENMAYKGIRIYKDLELSCNTYIAICYGESYEVHVA